MPLKLIPKTKHLKLKPKRLMLKPRKTIPRRTIRESQRKIEEYIKEFSNIIFRRIRSACYRFPKLLGDSDAVDELHSIALEKFTKAIRERYIQLWRANDKMINVYIQRMVERLIIDKIRRQRRYHERFITKQDSNRISPERHGVLTGAGTEGDRHLNKSHACIQHNFVLQRPTSTEDQLITKELFFEILKRLGKYNPEGKELLLQLLDPNIDISMSSPRVHALKREVKVIMEALREEEN